MKAIARVRCCILFALLLVAAFFAPAQEKKRLTFEQVFKDGEPKLTTALPIIIGWDDDTHYLEMKKKDGDAKPKLYRVDTATGADTPLGGLEQFKDLAAGFNLDRPEAFNDTRTRYIFSKDKDLYCLDSEAKTFKRLTQSPGEEKTPTFSPDGNWVAFTRDGNLFAIELASGKEYQYTTDGAELIYNGYASWLYFEEILGRISRYRAFWWSPDSRYLAFYRFDDTRVPMFPLFRADGVHGELEKTRYPKPGDPNPEVQVGFVLVNGGKVVWADFNPKDDQYFGTPFWTPDSKKLFVQWLNRGQDDFKIYAVEAQTGRKNVAYAEHQPTWVDWKDAVTFLKDNQGFIVESDQDGWNHFYLYAMDGQLKKRLTSGQWAVGTVVTVDEKTGTLFFTAKKEASTRTDLYRVKLDGESLTRLTFGEFNHNVRMAPGGSFFITTYSNLTTPSKMALCDREGKVVRELGDIKGKEFDNYALAKAELFRIKTPDGYDLPAVWTLPLGFDPAKKYPVLINVYGGPNMAVVSESWRGIGGQWLAKEGVIQMGVDHRGAGHFGKAGAALMHRNLGKWEMNDYIEVVKWLHTQPFVDKTRICITGGSYGGYSTCLALTYGADYFTHGIAMYSVTDWHLYDSHYVERYMDLPDENPEGYKNGSVLTYANKLKGVLRIAHGTMDDNVHLQNVLQFIDKLEDLNKHFEFMVYPGERHGWRGPKSTHLRTENYRFYYQYLIDKPFPEELFK